MEHVTAGNQRSAGRHGASEFERCAEICLECYRACSKTFASCLEKGGKHAEAEHIRLLIDCARICEVSADFLVRGSALHHATCEACATVCEQCAENCRAVAGDEEMTRCAETCTRCAESCRQMSAH